MRIGIVAGEASGDILGAGLIGAVRAQYPRAEFFGIGGPRMAQLGCRIWWDSNALAVMGLVEVLKHLPRLLVLRRELQQRLLDARPDVFIGVDAPDFNLTLERNLKARGIRTMHYVSPSVWAWREYRVKKIARSVDRMLTLFPFEAAFYEKHGVPVTFVGHPLADTIPFDVDRAAACAQVGLDPQRPVIALLPGSRGSEVSRLIEPFLATAAWCARQRPSLQFVLPVATENVRGYIDAACRAHPGLSLTVLSGQSHAAIASADAVLVASGTATLECMLFNRPMVVAYRLQPLTYQLLRLLVGVRHVALPNLLSQQALVPEFIQDAVQPEAMGRRLLRWLDDVPARTAVQQQFALWHRKLRQNANAKVAQAVLAEILPEG